MGHHLASAADHRLAVDLHRLDGGTIEEGEGGGMVWEGEADITRAGQHVDGCLLHKGGVETPVLEHLADGIYSAGLDGGVADDGLTELVGDREPAEEDMACSGLRRARWGGRVGRGRGRRRRGAPSSLGVSTG